MQLNYQPLLQVDLRHTFYTAGKSLADFKVYPSADTQQWLHERGLVFRAEPGRFVVYAEVEPAAPGDPKVLKRALGDENIVLRFQLEVLNPYLFNISQLDQYRMGRELYCFDNLRDDQADSRFYLGDAVAATRLGKPIVLETAQTIDYTFKQAVTKAQLTLFDRFEQQLDSVSVAAPAGETITHYRYDLADVSGITPGRYRLQDDQTDGEGQVGTHAFFYDPNQFGGNLFGMIELFNRTEQLTPDQTDRVPAAYRFLDGDTLSGPDAFTLQLESRATRWRYTVNKQYANNAISLAQLSIDGPVGFDAVNEPERVIFTAQNTLPLAQTQQSLSLLHAGAAIRSLPNPAVSSPLDGDAVNGIQYSDIYLSV